MIPVSSEDCSGSFVVSACWGHGRVFGGRGWETGTFKYLPFNYPRFPTPYMRENAILCSGDFLSQSRTCSTEHQVSSERATVNCGWSTRADGGVWGFSGPEGWHVVSSISNVQTIEYPFGNHLRTNQIFNCQYFHITLVIKIITCNYFCFR